MCCLKGTEPTLIRVVLIRNIHSSHVEKPRDLECCLAGNGRSFVQMASSMDVVLISCGRVEGESSSEN